MRRVVFLVGLFVGLVVLVGLASIPFPVQAGCTGNYDPNYGYLISCTLSTADGCLGCKKAGDICQCTGYAQPTTKPPPAATATPATCPPPSCGQLNITCTPPTFAVCTQVSNCSSTGWKCTGTQGGCTQWSGWFSCYPAPDCVQTRYCVVGNADPQAQSCTSGLGCGSGGPTATPTPTPVCMQLYFCDTRAGSATKNTCIQTNSTTGYNNFSPYYQCPGTTTTCSQNLQTYLGISGSCYTSQASCQATCPTSTPTPTATPTPGPYIKLKNSSFVSDNGLKDDIPAVPTAYDADDDGTANFIITQGGIVAAPSVNLTTYNASAKPNPGNWSAAYTPAPFSMTPSNFLNYTESGHKLRF